MRLVPALAHAVPAAFAAVAALTGYLAVAPTMLSAQGTLRGVVFDSLRTMEPIAGAEVVVKGLSRTATSDRRGRFTIRDVPAGQYEVGFFHPSLDSLEISAPVVAASVTDGRATDVRLGMPSLSAMAAQLCAAPLAPASAVVFGVARSAEDHSNLRGAIASVRWYEVSITSGVARQLERFVADSTGADGRFVLCGIPNDIAVSMRVSAGRQATGMLHLSLDGEVIARHDAVVSTSDSASLVNDTELVDDTTLVARPPGSGRIRARVRDERGRPVRRAVVGVRGTSASAVTDGDGRALILGAPAGSQTIVARGIGLSPALEVHDVNPGAETVLEIELSRLPTELPRVAITGKPPEPVDRAYEARRKMGFGSFYTDREMKAAASDVSFWARVPGVFPMSLSSVGSDPMPMMHAAAPQPGQLFCIPNILVDGSPQPFIDPWELRVMMREAKRLEVYPRKIEVPVQFSSSSSGCGSILIWTR